MNTQSVLALESRSRGIIRNEALGHQLLLALAMTAGAFLRLWQINTLGYNSDEAVYAGQGAAIAQDPVLKDIFPIFRAHPMLFQFLLAVVFTFGANDLLGRLLSVAVGLATVYFVYRLGRLLYNKQAGLYAVLFLALMPYHVVVTRQVLLDGPMVLCGTVVLYLMARFGATQRPIWLYAAGAGMGLTFLAKETGVVLLGSIYAFLALSPKIRVRIRDIVVSTACMVLIIAPFPLSLVLAGGGGSKKTEQYLIWQLFRRPNHEWTFYLTTVPFAIGILVVLATVLGLWLLRHERTWRETLLVAWIIVPVTFFQLWPTKGFQYLLPIAPAFAILAGRTLARWSPQDVRSEIGQYFQGAWFPSAMAAVVALSLFLNSWERVQTTTSDTFLAGSGGVPGGREVGHWIAENTPEGSVLMTIGPSMANIIQFYGHRQAFGLSVSPNPLRRNPSYQPIHNPDLQLRSGELHYIVWDSFSAARSVFFSEKLLSYVGRYNGRVVHTESVPVTTPEGDTALKPVVIIYEVRP